MSDEYLQKNFHFTMDDRADIWNRIVIELKGIQSEIVYKDFVNQELA